MSTPAPSRRRRRRSNGSRPSAPQHRTAPAAPSTLAPSGPSGFSALGVPDVLTDALSASGITTPFPIQTATMADAVAGRDLLGQGRTGSGKTLAFTIPLVARLLAEPKARPSRPKALVLVPTRELALQVAEVASPLAAAAKRTVTTIFGGVSAQPQLRTLERGVDIVVACPGRLLDHLGTGALVLDDVRVCVLDEADHMADQGFLPMVRRILDRVPADAQKMLFSATLAGGVDAIVNRYLDDPVTHKTQSEPPALLEHRVLVVPEGDRLTAVIGLIDGGRTVVFARTKHRAKQFTRKLCARGVAAVELHGNLSQNARQRNLAAFAEGDAPVLVATDIAARGIHVDNVDTVIHIDPPIEHKAYTHRSGRTARAGEAGIVYTIADASQVRDLRALLTKAGVRATWTDQDGALVS